MPDHRLGRLVLAGPASPGPLQFSLVSWVEIRIHQAQLWPKITMLCQGLQLGGGGHWLLIEPPIPPSWYGFLRTPGLLDKLFQLLGGGWGVGRTPQKPTSLLGWLPVCILDSLLPSCGYRGTWHHMAIEGCEEADRDWGCWVLSKAAAEAEAERAGPCVCSEEQGSRCPYPGVGYTNNNTRAAVTPAEGTCFPEK